MRPALGGPGFLSSPVILIRNKWQFTKKSGEKVLILLMRLLDVFSGVGQAGLGDIRAADKYPGYRSPVGQTV